MIFIKASMIVGNFTIDPVQTHLLLPRSMLSCGARLIATVRTLTMGGSKIGCNVPVHNAISSEKCKSFWGIVGRAVLRSFIKFHNWALRGFKERRCFSESNC